MMRDRDQGLDLQRTDAKALETRHLATTKPIVGNARTHPMVVKGPNAGNHAKGNVGNVISANLA